MTQTEITNRYRANFVAMRLWELRHGHQRDMPSRTVNWQVISGAADDYGKDKGYGTTGTSFGAIGAKYSVIDIPTLRVIGVERHYLRLWQAQVKMLMHPNEDKRAGQEFGGLSDDEVAHVLNHLDRRLFINVFEPRATDKSVKRNSHISVTEYTAMGFMKLLKGAEVGELKVVYG